MVDLPISKYMADKSLPKLKKELDRIFSIYIRLRHADTQGNCKCFTCGKVAHYKRMQNGHFQSRRFLPTRFNEQNCQVQCVKCNMFMQGEQYKFAKFLDIEYQEGTSTHLEQLARSSCKFMRCDYMDLIKEYKAKVQLLTSNIDKSCITH